MCVCVCFFCYLLSVFVFFLVTGRMLFVFEFGLIWFGLVVACSVEDR